MNIPKIYDPSSVEQKWYAYWVKNKFFYSQPNPDKEAYSIVMPPPNVTGILHMGHMLNNTIQDVLVRRARMQGKNACWVPGTDHASIATEAKVVALIKESGKTKKDLGREKFLELAFQWKEKYGGIILEQLKKLGASCDWDRTRFTMEPELSEAVIDQFIRLHKEGLIYRGARMINWDPEGKTAVSDEEVIYKPVNGKLYYLRYYLVDSKEFILVATTRPETILADVALCVHPEDRKYESFVGKKVYIPLTKKEIPIITDSLVSMDFGTGCLKITPAHSLMDYEIGLKYGLPVIDILDEEGKINPLGAPYEGLDRFVARKKIVIDLQENNFLENSEPYTSQIGFSERTNSVIEPRISTQWFLKMGDMAQPALKAFIDGTDHPAIGLIPDKYLNTYRHWMDNIHDWCISRQLWWGQQIPAWYNERGEFVVAKTKIEAENSFIEKGLSFKFILQDEDVLDTWFSSWLWPVTVFGGVKDPNNLDFKYYYPTDDLVTAPEILFFWVARMVMIGLNLTGQVPFKNVYLTGIVRDKQGRKMSKSLGNSPDPLDLIQKYGADAIRIGLLMSSPAGNDLLYDESQIIQGRNFANKLWNAYRLIDSWSEKIGEGSSNNIPNHELTALAWFSRRIAAFTIRLPELYKQYRLSEIVTLLYRLTYDDFCGWFLEIIKPNEGEEMNPVVYQTSLNFFKFILKELHPFMPFITEELWQFVNSKLDLLEKKEKKTSKVEVSLREKSILFALPEIKDSKIQDQDYFPLLENITFLGKDLTRFSLDFENIIKPAISEIRNIRNIYQIPQKQGLKLGYQADFDFEIYECLLQKLAGITELEKLSVKPEDTSSFSFAGVEFNLFIEEKLDKEKEKAKIKEETNHLESFLMSVNQRLNNEKFMTNAKPVIKDLEIKKKEDTIEKLKNLKERLEALCR